MDLKPNKWMTIKVQKGLKRKNTKDSSIIYCLGWYKNIEVINKDEWQCFPHVWPSQVLQFKCRAYQLHMDRLENKKIAVPTHAAYNPTLPKLDKAK